MQGTHPQNARPPEPAEALAIAASRFALPRTIYVFLAILIASYIVPPMVRQLLAPTTTAHAAGGQSDLSEADFAKYVSAETNVRTAFLTGGDNPPSSKPDAFSQGFDAALGGRRAKLLRDARTGYLELSNTTHAPNMIRRVLILDHARGRPLDANLLEQILRPSLHLAATPSADIAAELQLWRAMYGSHRLAPADAASGDRRIRAMGLRFLEPRALADLWGAAGDHTHKTGEERRLRAAASAFISQEAVITGISILGFLIGIGFFILFLVAAFSGRWDRVRRVATAPLHLLWGDLLDAFVFYLAFYRFIGFFGSLIIAVTGSDLTSHALLGFEASTQVLTGTAAVFYLAGKARRHGVTLAEVGMTARGSLLREIGYGIAGYLAGLPFVLVMGLLSRLIFQHNTNTAPNPILPLIVGVHDPLSRGLIFLMASIAAPFFEETFFRGALFTGLRTRYGWQVSVVISASCFALVHPMQDWLPIFALGCTFATMREMRQSLVPGMTAHFLQNTLTFVVLSALFAS